MKYTICGTIEYEIEVNTDSPVFTVFGENKIATYNEYVTAIEKAQELIYKTLNGDNPAIVLLNTCVGTIEDENGDVIFHA